MAFAWESATPQSSAAYRYLRQFHYKMRVVFVFFFFSSYFRGQNSAVLYLNPFLFVALLLLSCMVVNFNPASITLNVDIFIFIMPFRAVF